mmetsp:Transcript_42183/g.131486  ORF Transcript_42183/g.131486 Transcript_42183/m.131486 type:complete len:291 (+) Transcript_42183:693-1565(+)
MSRRKACTSKCSSNRRERRHQSSYSKLEKRGWPLPTSQTFSTRIGSRFSVSTSGGFSSPSFLSSFLPSFFHSLSCSRTFFHSDCFFFQSSSSFCHSAQVSLNHVEGARSSTRCVALRFSTHSLRYSDAPAAGCHSKRTSSKPSSSPGRVNFENVFASSGARRSGNSLLRKTTFFSSSVSSTAGSSSFSSGASSSSFFSSASPSLMPALLRSASALFFSRSFLRSASSFLFLASASALAFLSCKMAACTPSLKASPGSPSMTMAFFLKPENLSSKACRPSGSRFLRISGTT